MKFLYDLYNQLLDGEFSKGFVMGAATVLGAMLFLWLLNLVFSLCRRKTCHELKIDENDGTLSVSDDAVIALVKLLSGEFRELTIKKVKLLFASHGYRLDIQCGFTLAKTAQPFSALAPLFKQRIREGLCSALGFSGKLEINLKMIVVNGNPAPAAADAKSEKDTNASDISA